MLEVAERIDLTERFTFLNYAMIVDQRGATAIDNLFSRELSKEENPGFTFLLDKIDWDPALRNANRWYDTLVAATRSHGRATKTARLQKLSSELGNLKARLVNSEKMADFILRAKDPAEAKGKIVGDLLIGLLLPAILKPIDAADRHEQIERNLHLAFALDAYQRDHGRYPEKLDVLAPEYLPRVPNDLFTGKPLVYRPAANGYLLYSFGVNEKDDGGRWYDDDPPGDDPRVRMPLPKLKRPN